MEPTDESKLMTMVHRSLLPSWAEIISGHFIVFCAQESSLFKTPHQQEMEGLIVKAAISVCLADFRLALQHPVGITPLPNAFY